MTSSMVMIGASLHKRGQIVQSNYEFDECFKIILWNEITAHDDSFPQAFLPGNCESLDRMSGSGRTLVAGPGQAGVGRGIAFKTGAKRQAGTVLVVWEAAHPTPWVLRLLH